MLCKNVDALCVCRNLHSVTVTVFMNIVCNLCAHVHTCVLDGLYVGVYWSMDRIAGGYWLEPRNCETLCMLCVRLSCLDILHQC